MSTLHPRITLVLATLALAGCSLLAGRPEQVTVYSPQLTPAAAAPRGHAHWQLLVAEPRAIGALDSSRIVVMPQPGVVETYKGARWGDRATVMLQDLLLQAFQDSASLGGVGTSAGGIRPDFILQTDLRDFQAEYRSGSLPTVAVRLNVQLIENYSRRTIATRTFAGEQACATTDIHAVFEAFEQALGTVIPQIVEWAIEAGDAAQPAGTVQQTER